MRKPAVRALVAQAHALVHAEAVLLVDDHQRELREAQLVLEQGVRADRDPLVAAGERGLGLAPRLRRQPAGDEARRDAERREPAREILGVLLGEQLGRRHQRRLAACLDDIGGGHCRDDGLARADVALHEAQHRVRQREVAAHFLDHAPLRAGEPEAGAREQAIRQLAACGDRPGGITADRIAQLAQRELVREQLLEGEAPLRGMPAGVEHRQPGIRRRAMHVVQRLDEAGQAEVAQRPPAAEVGQFAAAGSRERLRGQLRSRPCWMPSVAG